MPRALRVVLTDLDDTLFDHDRATRLALSDVLGSDPVCAQWTIDELDRHHRVLLEAIHLRVLAGELGVDDARVERFGRLLEQAGDVAAASRAPGIARAYRRAYETSWFPVDGALALVAHIKQQGASIVIVTNNTVAEQREKVARLGLDAFVDHLVTSEETRCSKPAPAIFHEALRRANASADVAVMLGDAWATDIEGAKAAGLRPVWLNRFGAASPDPTVDELTSLAPATAAMAVLRRGM